MSNLDFRGDSPVSPPEVDILASPPHRFVSGWLRLIRGPRTTDDGQLVAGAILVLAWVVWKAAQAGRRRR